MRPCKFGMWTQHIARLCGDLCKSSFLGTCLLRPRHAFVRRETDSRRHAWREDVVNSVPSLSALGANARGDWLGGSHRVGRLRLMGWAGCDGQVGVHSPGRHPSVVASLGRASLDLMSGATPDWDNCQSMAWLFQEGPYPTAEKRQPLYLAPVGVAASGYVASPESLANATCRPHEGFRHCTNILVTTGPPKSAPLLWERMVLLMPGSHSRHAFCLERHAHHEEEMPPCKTCVSVIH